MGHACDQGRETYPSLTIAMSILFILISLSECPEGYYGNGCLEECVCENGAVCDHISGDCNCSAGWKGLTCDEGELMPASCNSAEILVSLMDHAAW